MGISTPKPSRQNTPNSRRFIDHFLKDVLKAILRIEKDPAQAQEFSSHFNETSPIKLEFLYNDSYKSVSIGMSPLDLTKQYGKPATRIWRKLFKQVQIGGYNAATRTKIPTRWAPHEEAIRALEHRIMACIGANAEVLASDYLAILSDFPELVPTITEYETIKVNGYERLVRKSGTKKKLMPRRTRSRILADQKPIRQEIAARNSEIYEKHAANALKRAFEAIVREDWHTVEPLAPDE